MADEHERRTLRALRARTGDAYVPLSEVLALLRDDADRVGSLGFRDERDLLLSVARSAQRRWGPGPRCEKCGDSGTIPHSAAPCDCEAARG